MPFQPNLTCLSENPLSELYATLVSVTQKVLHINARSLVHAEKPFAVRNQKRSTNIICRKCATTMRRKPDVEKDIFAIRES